MMPSLLPDLANLPAVLCTVVVGLLAIGLGAALGARRAETALIAGWGAAGLVTVVAGTLTRIDLAIVMSVLGLAGAAGLVWLAVAAMRGRPRLDCGMAGRTLLLAVPLLLLTEGMVTTGWDDFANWLPNLAYLCAHGHFPTLAQPSVSGHAAYPTALALPGYAGYLMLGRLPEDAAMTWNLLAMVAASAAVARVLLARLAGIEEAGGVSSIAGRPPPAAKPQHPEAVAWAAAAAGLLFVGLACPSFVAKVFFSNMADASTAMVVAVMGCLVYACWSEPAPAERRRIAWLFGLAGAALIDLRQANLALLLLLYIGAACGIAWHWWGPRPRTRLGAGWLAALALPLPFVTWLLWRRYAAAEIPGGDMPLMPYAQWHWAQFPSALASIGRVMLAKTGLFTLIAVLAVRAVLALRRRDPLSPAERSVLFVAVVVCLGDIGFLALAYLAVSFSPEEAAAAASFWRYAGETGPLAVLGAAVVLPLAWTARIPARRAAAGLVALVLLLPIVTVKFYRFDLDSPVPLMRRIAVAVDRLVPPGQPVTLVDFYGNGFFPILAGYQIAVAGTRPGFVPRPFAIVATPHGLPAQEDPHSWLASPYVWLTQGAPAMQPLVAQPPGEAAAGGQSAIGQSAVGASAVGQSAAGHSAAAQSAVGQPPGGQLLNPDCSYLLARKNDRFTVIGQWALGIAAQHIARDAPAAAKVACPS